MFSSPIAFIALAFFQSSTAELVGEAPILQTPPAPKCVCSAPHPSDAFIEGYVIDAELTLAPSGLDVNSRQATVFDVHSSRVNQKLLGKIVGKTHVWHSSDLGACGLRFDYAKKYKVFVTKGDNGDWEANRCMQPNPPVAPTTDTSAD